MVLHFPAQLNSKHTVNPRAPVWYRPKALRCLSLGRCAICLEFRCGTLGINRGAATCQSGQGCPNDVIGRSCTEGVNQVPLRESSEGDLNSSSGENTALPFGNPTGGGAKPCSSRHDQLRG
ncbi:unnamed protein product [Prunus armeniaca]